MFQRDYLMRQIEMIGRMLGEIVALAVKGRHSEALGLFDQAYQPLLGVGANAAGTLSEEQLLALVSRGGPVDPQRLAALAEVLKVEGDVRAGLGRRDESLARWRRALALTARLAGERGGLPDPALARELADRLGGFELVASLNLQRCRVYEALGRFADAEDALFHAIDANPGAGHPVEAGIGFYRRLLALDDAALEAGDLPRAEVEAALAELLRRDAG